MRDTASYVARWRKNFDVSQRRRRAGPLTPIALALPIDAPSPVMSDWSDESIETVMDGTNDVPQGTYNIDPPYVENTYASVSLFE